MKQIVWTAQAISDLASIREYISQDSEHYADLTVSRLIDVVGRLTRFPDSGRVVPELQRRDLREVLHRNYRLVYRIVGDEVQILTVFHGARLLDLPDNAP